MSSSTELPQTVLELPLTGLCVATGYSRIKNAINPLMTSDLSKLA